MGKASFSLGSEQGRCKAHTGEALMRKRINREFLAEFDDVPPGKENLMVDYAAAEDNLSHSRA
jgi:hypothetical protein